eukprot:TRINITY_DN5275_c0_g1_i3.p1 TRINITY_DN5275_c0_g1~~TRINITY_DN5275_c0_g1_i3.p1  ORF type:complete len:120 (+),score=7.13 TRINITY_DN5275_c0_g1_i3:157-516(+)
MSKQSVYKKEAMDSKEEQRERLVDNICEYPYILAKRGKSVNRFKDASSQFNSYSTYRLRESELSITSAGTALNKPLAIKLPPQNQKLILYKGAKKLNNTLHKVEIENTARYNPQSQVAH